MYYLIYKITNLINNKIYIGKHITKDKNDDYMGSGKLITRAIEKYGLENFKKEILFQCNSQQQLNQMQKNIVNEEFVARLDTYNLKIGGAGGWDFINKNNLNLKTNFKNKTPQEIAYISKLGVIAYRFLYETDIEFRQKIIDGGKKGGAIAALMKPFKGKKHTQTVKKQIGEKNAIHQQGENNSTYNHVWIHNQTLQISKLCHPNDLENLLENGWKKGRKMYNINMKQTKLSNQQKIQLLSKYSIQQIADMYGITYNAVKKWKKKLLKQQ